MDLRKETAIFAIDQRSFGKLIIRQPLAAASAIAGGGQAIRLNGLQELWLHSRLSLAPTKFSKSFAIDVEGRKDGPFIHGGLSTRHGVLLLVVLRTFTELF